MGNVNTGHGALIAMEGVPLPIVSGSFTTIAQLNGDIAWPELSRDEAEITPHQNTIDAYDLSYIKRGPITFGLNFIDDDPTHDHLTGVYKAMADGQIRGFRLREKGGTAGVKEWIMSGQVQKIVKKAPVKAGVVTCDVTIRVSGAQIINGVVYAS